MKKKRLGRNRTSMFLTNVFRVILWEKWAQTAKTINDFQPTDVNNPDITLRGILLSTAMSSVNGLGPEIMRNLRNQK